jgi:hypothetical protein
MAYSMLPPLKALGGLGEAPHQSKENNHDNDVENVQHGEPLL